MVGSGAGRIDRSGDLAGLVDGESGRGYKTQNREAERRAHNPARDGLHFAPTTDATATPKGNAGFIEMPDFRQADYTLMADLEVGWLIVRPCEVSKLPDRRLTLSACIPYPVE